MADALRAPYGTIPATALVVRDADIDQTAENNVFPGAATICSLSVDNTGNQAQQNYMKLYDAAAATVGTTAPNMVLPVAGGTVLEMVILIGSGAVPGGYSFATGVSLACVTTGGTAGAAGPTSPVTLALLLK